MNYLFVRKMKPIFLLAVFFQVLNLPVILAQTDSRTAAQVEKPSSPVEIQKALAEAGYYQGAIDGIIGAKTRAAIRSFQEENGLAVDGLVGPKTWEKLKAYLEEAKDMDEENTLAETELIQTSSVEESPDYSAVFALEPEPLITEDDLKQKLVS